MEASTIERQGASWKPPRSAKQQEAFEGCSITPNQNYTPLRVNSNAADLLKASSGKDSRDFRYSTNQVNQNTVSRNSTETEN